MMNEIIKRAEDELFKHATETPNGWLIDGVLAFSIMQTQILQAVEVVMKELTLRNKPDKFTGYLHGYHLAEQELENIKKEIWKNHHTI